MGEDCDFVLTRSEFSPEAPQRLMRVLNKQVRVSQIWNLHVGGERIGTTREHPFFVLGKGWTPAGRLEMGDTILGSNGMWTRVEGCADSGRMELVYNFHVQDDKTYFVGDARWGWDLWVHNSHNTASLTGSSIENEPLYG